MMKTVFEQDEEKCIVQSRSGFVDEKNVTAKGFPIINRTICPVCSEEARRQNAKFCRVCGHNLREDYAPLDALKASYSLRKQTGTQNIRRPKSKKMQKVFAENTAENRNQAVSIATAFMVYSLVPYLGILFCPGTLVFGGIGLVISFKKPQFDGKQSAISTLLLGLIILSVQILLWYLLYLVPKLHK